MSLGSDEVVRTTTGMSFSVSSCLTWRRTSLPSEPGRLRSSKIAPKYKVMQNALQNAMKIATQFGFSTSSRSSLSMPEQDEERNDDYNFLE